MGAGQIVFVRRLSSQWALELKDFRADSWKERGDDIKEGEQGLSRTNRHEAEN